MKNATGRTKASRLQLSDADLAGVKGGAEVITFGYHDNADHLIGAGVQIQVGNNFTTLGAYVDGSGLHVSFTNEKLSPVGHGSQ